jgi:hypothetical protein
MIKQEIRSLVRNTLPKYDKSNSYHDVFLNGVIEKAIGQMYEDVWRMNPLNLQRYVKQYGYLTPIAVLTENSTGIKYSLLPESIHVFQDKSSGVRRISTPLQGRFMFFPLDAREVDLISNGSFADTVNSKVGYVVNQTRIEYYNMSTAIETSGVRMDLIVPFSKYSESDEVKIPEIADTRTGETFMDRVLKILQVIRPTDLKDDNSAPMGSPKDN